MLKIKKTVHVDQEFVNFLFMKAIDFTGGGGWCGGDPIALDTPLMSILSKLK